MEKRFVEPAGQSGRGKWMVSVACLASKSRMLVNNLCSPNSPQLPGGLGLFSLHYFMLLSRLL